MADFDVTNPKYSNQMRMLEPTDPAHADLFNGMFQQFLENDEVLKNITNFDYLTVGSRLKDSVIGKNSVALGSDNIATGYCSLAEGEYNQSIGRGTHAEGSTNISSGDAAHAEGYSCKANGHYSHAEGAGTTASGIASHAEGNTNTVTGANAHVEGENNIVNGQSSHAEGGGNVINADYAHAEGGNGYVRSNYSHIEGQGCVAGGSDTDKGIGRWSHAEGNGSRAIGDCSHAEGNYTIASYGNTHAEGFGTQASGQNSHAEGSNTKATNWNTHAEGALTEANGNESHASGLHTIANGPQQFVCGGFNAPNNFELFQIGNGSSDTNRKNALSVDRAGNVFAAGEVHSAWLYSAMNKGSVVNNNYSFIERSGKFCILYFDMDLQSLNAFENVIAASIPDGFKPAYQFNTTMVTNTKVIVTVTAYTDGLIRINPLENTPPTFLRGQLLYFRA